MKLSVMCAGYANPHAGWAAIDELADLFAHYYDAEKLAPVARAPSRWERCLGRRRPRWQALDSRGGDVLLVVAHGPEQLAMIEALGSVRQRFDRIYAWVTDSYFAGGFGRATAQFDAITVTAAEDAALPRSRYGVTVHQVYQGADCLTWHPGAERARDIDLIGFGRMPPSYHAQFAAHCHAPQSELLYLHSPLGNIAGPSVRQERGMLFKLLQRSKLSLAFHLFVEPQGQRPRSMMVTSRWLESLLAGCVVAGRRPESRMAEDMLFWPGATRELDADPRQAVEQVRHWLRDEAALEAQRRSNVQHMLRHHDWRHRIAQMAGLFALPLPPSLQDDLGRLAQRAEAFA